MYKILLSYFFAFNILLLTACVGNNNNQLTSPTTNNSSFFINNPANESPELSNILNDFVESYAKNNYFSAISATVRCGNNQVSGVAGTIESDSAVLIDTNSLFQIGSTSKSFTSVVILQLADDPKYKFSLNDTIGKWFRNLDDSPEYPQCRK